MTQINVISTEPNKLDETLYMKTDTHSAIGYDGVWIQIETETHTYFEQFYLEIETISGELKQLVFDRTVVKDELYSEGKVFSDTFSVSELEFEITSETPPETIVEHLVQYDYLPPHPQRIKEISEKIKAEN